jgi:alkanesulfonate monooxygenase SsuD/methylene tetrahydromethanopterin reductase-like flavin-dependent oxidoreductase (luciferase family)
MQLALMTEPHLGMTYDTLLDMARFAERTGLAAFARSDHYAVAGKPELHTTDAFVSLAGLARETSRIELVVLVSPITFRHPAVIAKAAATIDEMSGGRFTLGVGTGWAETEHTRFGIPFPDMAERFARLEEALDYLHHAFGRRTGALAGTYYALEASAVRPRPTGLRIVVGGSGERRTPRLAGTYADEYNFTLRPGADIAVRITRTREAAERAGRNPDDILISIMTQVIAGVTRADFERNLARVAAADPWGIARDELEAHHRERGYPMGIAGEVQQRIGELVDLGVGRIYLQHFGPYEDDLLEETFAVMRG